MDKRLGQRLVGAGVVLALAIIIVPELIKEPVESGKPVVEAPSRPQLTSEGVTTTTLSLPASEQPLVTEPPVAAQPSPEPPAPVAEPVDEEEPQPIETARLESRPALETIDITEPPEPPVAPVISVETPAPKPEPKPAPKPEPKVVPKPEPKPAPKPVQAPKPKPAKPAEPPIELPKIELIGRASTASPPPSASSGKATNKSGNWIVQAGSFSLMQNATLLKDKLRTRGFDASIERATVSGRTLYRVRVGPQASHSESRRVRDRLQREMGIKGQVVALGG